MTNTPRKSRTISDTPKPSQFVDPDLLMAEAETAKLIGVTPHALRAWRKLGSGPNYVRISQRCVRYRRRDLTAWAEQRLRAGDIPTKATTTKH